MFLPTRRGSIRLFRIAGIEVFLNWTWLLVPIYFLQYQRGTFSSIAWVAFEYVCLFGIVLMHEFGHALACRQVGGTANEIVLWPLGGVAYVSPPQRPGPILWTIAAGPLVNVLLVPVLAGALLIGGQLGWDRSVPDFYRLIVSVWQINLGLLIFNLLPIYPLDGGQILRSLLWFVFGKARSLMLAVIVGFAGVALLAVVAFLSQNRWTWVMVVFILLHCSRGLLQARFLARMAKLPRRAGYVCPSCKEAPILGPVWICHRCRARFDIFETKAVCPNCGEVFPVIRCADCGEARPMAEWRAASSGVMPPPLPGAPRG